MVARWSDDPPALEQHHRDARAGSVTSRSMGRECRLRLLCFSAPRPVFALTRSSSKRTSVLGLRLSTVPKMVAQEAQRDTHDARILERENGRVLNEVTRTPRRQLADRSS